MDALRWGITAAELAKDTGDDQAIADARTGLVTTLATSRYLGSVPTDPDTSDFVIGPDGLLLTRDEKKQLTLWDDTHPGQRDLSTPLDDVGGEVSKAAFIPSTGLLVTFVTDGPLTVWNMQDRTKPRALGSTPGGKNWVTAVVASSDGTRLFTGDTGGSVSVWDLADPTHPRFLGTGQPGPTSFLPGTSLANLITDVALCPDGTTLVSATSDTVTTWDVADAAAPRGNCRHSKDPLTESPRSTLMLTARTLSRPTATERPSAGRSKWPHSSYPTRCYSPAALSRKGSPRSNGKNSSPATTTDPPAKAGNFFRRITRPRSAHSARPSRQIVTFGATYGSRNDAPLQQSRRSRMVVELLTAYSHSAQAADLQLLPHHGSQQPCACPKPERETSVEPVRAPRGARHP